MQIETLTFHLSICGNYCITDRVMHSQPETSFCSAICSGKQCQLSLKMPSGQLKAQHALWPLKLTGFLCCVNSRRLADYIVKSHIVRIWHGTKKIYSKWQKLFLYWYIAPLAAFLCVLSPNHEWSFDYEHTVPWIGSYLLNEL